MRLSATTIGGGFLFSCFYIMSRDTLIHKSKWYWGFTEAIVMYGGIGLVEVQFDKDTNYAFIRGLSVHHKLRRHGVGKELMETCEQRARKYGRAYMQLSVHKDKDWLARWCSSLGYDVISQDEHEYVMIKRL